MLILKQGFNFKFVWPTTSRSNEKCQIVLFIVACSVRKIVLLAQTSMNYLSQKMPVAEWDFHLRGLRMDGNSKGRQTWWRQIPRAYAKAMQSAVRSPCLNSVNQYCDRSSRLTDTDRIPHPIQGWRWRADLPARLGVTVRLSYVMLNIFPE